MSDSPRALRRLWLAVAFCLLVAFLSSMVASPAREAPRRPVSARGGGTDPSRALIADAHAPLAPVVRGSIRNDTSPRLLSLRSVHPTVARAGASRQAAAEPALPNRDLEAVRAASAADPVVQTSVSGQTPDPVLSIPALGNSDNAAPTGGYSFVPPDPNGDVGAGFYVEVVNGIFAVYSTGDGSIVYGPVAIDTVWSGFGGPCETHLDGDPIVVFDEFAGRWVLSQFALSFPSDFHECVAVSKTSDPTGQWYRYDFKYLAPGAFNDYPKIGVWPDGYYMSANQFDGNTQAWAGAGATVFERSAMLEGLSAREIYINLASKPLSGMLPADVDGAAPPAQPEIFAQIDDDAWGYTNDHLELWGFAANWTSPNLSTFTKIRNVPVSSFDSAVCAGSCIAQPGTAQKLDPLSDRLMYRLQYRNFGDRQVLVTSHTVNAGGHAAVRWYDVENSGSGWSVAQSGTYAPTAENRWMGSAAMDANGDLAIGYSVSSSGTDPSVRLAARQPGDAVNTLEAEGSAVVGGNVQTGSDRWGDYSSMSVDPTDGCTFWYAGEYYQGTSGTGWETRLVEFRFPSCVTGTSGPGPAIVSGPTFGQSYQVTPSFEVDWSASGGTTPLTYDVRYRYAPTTGAFGAPVTWFFGTSSTSATFTGAPGGTYCFSARAIDAQPVTGAWGTEVCTATPMDDTAMKAVGSWSRKTGSGYYLGTFTSSSHKGDVLQAKGVQASDLAVVVTKCPTCGKARILWNGVAVATVNLYSAATQKAVVIPVATLGRPQIGTVKVVVRTAGKPVRIEGLGVLRA